MRVAMAWLGAMALMLARAYAKEQHFAAEANGQINFVMPSNNVGCIYTPQGGTSTYEPVDGGPELSCDRVEPSYVNVTLGPKGPAVVTENPGEQPCCSADSVFAYGNSAHFDGFVCSSAATGLSCRSDDKKHGFAIAKAKITHY